MALSRSLPAALLLSLLLVACKDDPAQPPSTGISFPLNSGDVWVYKYTRYDLNGQQEDESHNDTARVTGTITVGGRTGTRIRTGYTEMIDNDSVQVSESSYDESAYSVDGNALYALLDVDDSNSIYGERWLKIADDAGTTWTALDTTVAVNATVSTRMVVTGKRGGERTIKVKGADHVGREYLLTINTTQTESGVAQETYSFTTHYWIAPGVGILAFRADPVLFLYPFERVLIDYTIQ